MKIPLLILILQLTPSLGDIARQERARQKDGTVAATTKTITNETLGTAIAEPEALPASDKPANKAADTAKPHDEAWWRDAFKEARSDVQRAEDRSKVLELEIRKLKLDLLTKSDLYNREGVLGPQITAKEKDLDAAHKDADTARSKVTQLEEDLRRAGAPSGWSR